MAVTFDLFGTLVRVDGPAEPATAVATALDERGVTVPADWATAYREHHVQVEDGAELALSTHVTAALESRGVSARQKAVDAAVREAFEPTVQTVPGARSAVEAAADRGPVGVCSNCAVAGLPAEALDRSAIVDDVFDAVVTSVEVGWRKPDRRIFEAAADELDCDVAELLHVGDDPATDGGIEAVGGTFVPVDDEVPSITPMLEGSP